MYSAAGTGDYELVGFIVGLVDRSNLLDGSRIAPGDALIALPSSGLHTNGYSLARRVLFDRLGLRVEDALPGDPAGRSVAEHLLAVHRTYLPTVGPHLGAAWLNGMAHITGGGLTDNLPRILPAGCRAEIDLTLLRVPELFRLIARGGEIDPGELLRVFNLGVGMVLVVSGRQREAALAALGTRSPGEPWLLGEVVSGPSGVAYRGELALS